MQSVRHQTDQVCCGQKIALEPWYSSCSHLDRLLFKIFATGQGKRSAWPHEYGALAGFGDIACLAADIDQPPDEALGAVRPRGYIKRQASRNL